MAQNFLQDGDILDFTAAGNVTAGAGILIGTKLGVPLKSGVSGDVIPVKMTGVFTFPKDTGASTNFNVGGIVYWNDTSKKVTGVSSGNTAIGYAFETAGTSAAVAKVKLNG
jgi:predicted RecA/RadA family phage recombinase